MDLVIDIQCYKDFRNIASPKEVAIVDLKGDFFAHWIVAASAPVTKLSRFVKRENNWLTQNHHGLEYTDGDVSQKALYKSLRSILVKARKIYVRGEEKWKILNDLTMREIINLENVEHCPSFANLPWEERYCIHHAQKSSHALYACALNNAHRLKQWLNTNTGKQATETTAENECRMRKNLNELCDNRSLDCQPPFYHSISESSNIRHEQPRSIELLSNNSATFRGCFSCGSNSPGADETDSIRFQYG